MKGQTITRAHLVEAVHRKLGLSRAESVTLVEDVIREICVSLARGENVKLSSFGSFILRDKGQRVGRNPKTGVEVKIPPGNTIRFKPGKELRNLL